VLKKQVVPGSHKSNFPMPQELSYMEEMTDMIHNPSAEVRENGFFCEFSLCLSRACLGKMIIFMYKWLKNAV